jgi:hypothetical protein
LYTADPVARNRFRSTSAHATLQVDGAEQNELREDRLFALADRAHGELLEWQASDEQTTFIGRHHGFEALAVPATHTRTLRLERDPAQLTMTDVVESEGPHELTWRLPLAGGQAELTSDGILVRFDAALLTIFAPGLEARIEAGWVSPSYGVLSPASVVTLTGPSSPGRHLVEIVFRVAPR